MVSNGLGGRKDVFAVPTGATDEAGTFIATTTQPALCYRQSGCYDLLHFDWPKAEIAGLLTMHEIAPYVRATPP